MIDRRKLDYHTWGMILEKKHRLRIPGMEPQEGGFRARNVGRPKLTKEDLQERYRETTNQVDRSIRSIRLGFGCMPLAASSESDLTRLTDLLRALEAAESVMEADGLPPTTAGLPGSR